MNEKTLPKYSNCFYCGKKIEKGKEIREKTGSVVKLKCSKKCGKKIVKKKVKLIKRKV